MATKAVPAKPEPKPLTDEQLRQIHDAIEAIGEMGKRLSKAGLEKRAIIVLLQDVTGLPKQTIKQVLDAIEVLPGVFLKAAR